jgi:hypothetical protein
MYRRAILELRQQQRYRIASILELAAVAVAPHRTITGALRAVMPAASMG